MKNCIVRMTIDRAIQCSARLTLIGKPVRESNPRWGYLMTFYAWKWSFTENREELFQFDLFNNPVEPVANPRSFLELMGLQSPFQAKPVIKIKGRFQSFSGNRWESCVEGVKIHHTFPEFPKDYSVEVFTAVPQVLEQHS